MCRIPGLWGVPQQERNLGDLDWAVDSATAPPVGSAGWVLTADLVADIAAGVATAPGSLALLPLADVALGAWLDALGTQRGINVSFSNPRTWVRHRVVELTDGACRAAPNRTPVSWRRAIQQNRAGRTMRELHKPMRMLTTHTDPSDSMTAAADGKTSGNKETRAGVQITVVDRQRRTLTGCDARDPVSTNLTAAHIRCIWAVRHLFLGRHIPSDSSCTQRWLPGRPLFRNHCTHRAMRPPVDGPLVSGRPTCSRS